MEEIRDWLSEAVFVGPTLRRQEVSPFKDEQPACATCPAGQWYRAADQFRCFCIAFRTEMYAKGLPLVQDCDAREYALQEMADNP